MEFYTYQIKLDDSVLGEYIDSSTHDCFFSPSDYIRVLSQKTGMKLPAPGWVEVAIMNEKGICVHKDYGQYCP